MKKSKSNKPLLFILIIISVVSLYNNYNLANRITNLEANLHHYVQLVRYHQPNQPSSNKNESNWISKANYSVAVKNNVADLNFKLSVKELNKNELLYLHLVNEQNQAQDFKLQAINSFDYSVNAKIDSSKYNAYIVSKNGDNLRREKIGKINTDESAKALIDGDRHSIKQVDDITYVEFYVSVQLLPANTLIGTIDADESSSITEIKADVYMGSQNLGEIDLLNKVGFTEKEIKNISIRYNGNRSAIDKKLIIGHCELNNEDYEYYQSKISQKQYKDVEIFFLVKVKDSNGGEYQKLINSIYYKLENNKVVRVAE